MPLTEFGCSFHRGEFSRVRGGYRSDRSEHLPPLHSRHTLCLSLFLRAQGQFTHNSRACSIISGYHGNWLRLILPEASAIVGGVTFSLTKICSLLFYHTGLTRLSPVGQHLKFSLPGPFCFPTRGDWLNGTHGKAFHRFWNVFAGVCFQHESVVLLEVSFSKSHQGNLNAI